MLHRLTQIQKVILLEECWSELFLLNAIQWCIPLETNLLFNASDHLAAIPNGKASQVAADIKALNEILHRFRLIAVDPAEFACMKAVVLFRAGISIFFIFITNISATEH